MSKAEATDSVDLNTAAYVKWRAVVTTMPHFVAFVDGDEVDRGSDYKRLVQVASGLRACRGEGAVLSIFDTKTDQP